MQTENLPMHVISPREEIDNVEDQPLLSSKHSKENLLTPCFKQILLYFQMFLILLFISGLFVGSILLFTYLFNSTNNSNTSPSSCRPTSYYFGLNNSVMFDEDLQFHRQQLQQQYDSQPNTILAYGKWIRSDDSIEPFVAIFMKKGKISDVTTEESQYKIWLQNIPPNTNVFNLGGKFVMPGIIDAHSHVGIESFPFDYRAHDDVNEDSTPLTPMARAIDGINVKDVAFPQMLRTGITTIVVIPGSNNVMGGEGLYLKNRVSGNTTNPYHFPTVSSMLLLDSPRTLKMACGENPKTYYGYGPTRMTPISRQGNAMLMRQVFEEAKQLMQKQDQWDCDPTNRSKPLSERPNSLRLDSIVQLLRRQNIVLNVHCYEIHDFEMMIRLSQEFNFEISAFHHALEAHLIADMLKRHNISVVTFTDLFGYKVEADQQSVKMVKFLFDAGVPVAVKSDHPETSGRLLFHQAQRAFYYGLTAYQTLQTVTSIPAKIIKLENRIGTIAPGLEADVIVMDRHPMAVGVRVDKVFVEGKVMLDRNLSLQVNQQTVVKSNEPLLISSSIDMNSYCIRNVNIYTMVTSYKAQMGTIVVQNGIIKCVGEQCDCGTLPIVSLKNGIVTPGFVESSTSLGLGEIAAEQITLDGFCNGDCSSAVAKDGVRMQTKPMAAAFQMGITTTVTHRQGKNLLNGYSSAFYTFGRIVEEALINATVGSQISIGYDTKSSSSGLGSTISGQFAQLRSILKDTASELYQSVMVKKLPLIAKCHNADDIGHLLSLQEEFDFELIIIGGAEANFIADRLAKPNIKLVLTPTSEYEHPKQKYETQRTDEEDFGADVLFKAGVRFAMGMGSSLWDTRNLRFSAGLICNQGWKTESSFDFESALASITSIPADMFHLPFGIGRIVVDTLANFVLFDGNPLTYEGRPRMIAVPTSKAPILDLEQF